MTDQQHPITPPPELRNKWLDEAPITSVYDYLLEHAAQWGSDQELEACCGLLIQQGFDVVDDLRAARRPKPPTLNSIALRMLGTIERDAHYLPEITDTIRKALEQLND